jgi:hypothetical protein
MGRTKLFDDGDRVSVSINDETKIGQVVQYDSVGRKVMVKYEGQKAIDQTWIPIKNITKIDTNNKPIKKADRSTSRGRTTSPAKSSSKSPTKKSVSSRTRSKSRDRKPKTGGGDAPDLNKSSNAADFSSADEEALAPSKDTPATSRGRSTAKANKTANNNNNKKSTATKSKSPTRQAKSKSPTRSSARQTKKAAEKAAAAAVADFSADDEMTEEQTKKLIEKNSKKDEDVSKNDKASTNSSSSTSNPLCKIMQPICNTSKTICNMTCKTIKTILSYPCACVTKICEFCKIPKCSGNLCGNIKNAANYSFNKIYDGIYMLLTLICFLTRVTLMNLPMVVTFFIANWILLFLIDKKNIKFSHFHKDNFNLPSLPENIYKNLNILTCSCETWKANFFHIIEFLKFPSFMLLGFHTITKLCNYFRGYKRVIGANPRATTFANLRKVWLSFMIFTVFVMYGDKMMDKVQESFNKIMPFALPEMVIIFFSYIRQGIQMINGFVYNGFATVFLDSKKFYYSLILLATFKSYQDHKFQMLTDWRTWFLNDESTTTYCSRFNVSFGLEMFEQIAYLILAIKNPTNKYLWLLVNANFVLGFLTTRSCDSKADKSQTTEGISVKRHYQSTLHSGFWFYFFNIFKLFTYMSFWRFISKVKTMTDCQWHLGAFPVFVSLTCLRRYQSRTNFPSEKRVGIHGKIRNSERLADILHVMTLLLLCNFSFGNAPLVISIIYLILTILDLHISEECCLSKSPSKWKSYHGKVKYRMIPGVY